MKGEPTNILVVDDEASMRELLRDFLISQGYRVESCSTGTAALKVLRDNSEISAIISHVQMSPMTGLELLEKVRKDHRDLPVILFTGAASPEEHKQVRLSGATHYLTKPFRLSTLADLLAESMGAPKRAALPFKR